MSNRFYNRDGGSDTWLTPHMVTMAQDHPRAERKEVSKHNELRIIAAAQSLIGYIDSIKQEGLKEGSTMVELPAHWFTGLMAASKRLDAACQQTGENK
jgi:hypothetical protein